MQILSKDYSTNTIINMYTYASIIPLIGGITLGAEQALGGKPKWIASWGSVFNANDKYALQYYSEVPYVELDGDDNPGLRHVDIVTALPPCAGLSMGNSSASRGCNAASNIHMLRAAELTCRSIKPRAMIVENAPNLFSKAGEEFAERINDIANTYDYTMSIIKTSTIKHGLPQERTRSFYVLWKGHKVPILHQVDKQYVPLHEFLGSRSFKQSPFVTNNTSKPSSDPLWQFIMSKHPSESDQQIIAKYASKRMVSVWEIIYKNGWLEEAVRACSSEPKLGKWLARTLDKKRQGLNIMDASQKVAWIRTQALMWKTMPYLRHPLEDRWLMTSEALALMGFPDDFVEIDTKQSNVICQNCPVSTSADWIREIKEALDGNREWVDPPLHESGGRKLLRQSNITKLNPMKPIWSV